jgi:hypothetical protein
VVAADEGDAVRVTHLEGQKQKEGLHRVIASIHEVAQKKIVGVWTLAANLE